MEEDHPRSPSFAIRKDMKAWKILPGYIYIHTRTHTTFETALLERWSHPHTSQMRRLHVKAGRCNHNEEMVEKMLTSHHRHICCSGFRVNGTGIRGIPCASFSRNPHRAGLTIFIHLISSPTARANSQTPVNYIVRSLTRSMIHRLPSPLACFPCIPITIPKISSSQPTSHPADC